MSEVPVSQERKPKFTAEIIPAHLELIVDDSGCIVLRCLDPWMGTTKHHHTLSDVQHLIDSLGRALAFRHMEFDRPSKQKPYRRLKKVKRG